MLRVVFRERLNQRGSSILSVLTAVTLLGISSAGLYQYMQNFQKTTVSTVEKATIDPLLKELAVNNMKSLLLEKGVSASGGAGQNNNGICAFLEPPTVISGVQALKMSFSQTSTLSNARWQVFFPKTEWRKEPISSCQNMKKGALQERPWVKCFKYLGDYRSNSSDTIYILAEIVPLVMDPESKPPIGPLKNLAEKVDPKKVIFQLMVTSALKPAIEVLAGTAENEDSEEQEVSGAQETPSNVVETYIGYSSDLVWANEVGECSTRAKDGNQTIVRLSATGTGSNLENFVLNNPSFSKNLECENQIRFTDLNENVIRVGRRADDLNVSTIVNLNARVACTRNRFRCPYEIEQDFNSTQSNEYDPLTFSFFLTNNAASSIQFEKVSVNLHTQNGELDKIADGKLAGADISVLQDGSSQPNWRNIRTEISKNNPLLLEKGSHTMNVSIQNQANYCHNICQNYSQDKKNTYVYPEVKLKSTGTCEYSSNFKTNEKNRTQCIVCHTKACHRYGLGTFGPYKPESSAAYTSALGSDTIFGLQPEALDSQVPECITDIYHKKLDSGSMAQARQKIHSAEPRSTLPNPNTCEGIAYTLDSNKFGYTDASKYVAKSCSKRLPVICFIGGQYLPALKINPNNLTRPATLVTGTFQEAQEICYELGREVGKSRDLAIYFKNSYPEDLKKNAPPIINATLNTLPVVSGSGAFDILNPITSNKHKYSYINNAIRGMFLAPLPYGDKPQRLIKESQKIIQTLRNSNYNHAWLALERDPSGFVVSSPPWALVAKDDPFTLYQNHPLANNIGERLVLLKETSSIPAPSPHYALSYNVRWKGLMPQPETARHKFVCLNARYGTIFISNRSGTLSQGHEKCKAEGGVFSTPVSPIEWTSAMLQLNPNYSNYPFPDPGIQSSNKASNSLVYEKSVANPMAWVALKQTTTPTTSDRAPLAKEFKSYFDSSFGSIFRADSRAEMETALSQEVNTTNPVYVINGKGEVLNSDQKIQNLYNEDILISETDKNFILDNYYFVCQHVVGNTGTGIYAPNTIDPLRKFNSSSCQKSLDIVNTSDSKFRPGSYYYMRSWMMRKSDNQKIILNPSKARALLEKARERTIKVEEERAAEQQRAEEERAAEQQRAEEERAAEQQRAEEERAAEEEASSEEEGTPQ